MWETGVPPEQQKIQALAFRLAEITGEESHAQNFTWPMIKTNLNFKTSTKSWYHKLEYQEFPVFFTEKISYGM